MEPHLGVKRLRNFNSWEINLSSTHHKSFMNETKSKGMTMRDEDADDYDKTGSRNSGSLFF